MDLMQRGVTRRNVIKAAVLGVASAAIAACARGVETIVGTPTPAATATAVPATPAPTAIPTIAGRETVNLRVLMQAGAQVDFWGLVEEAWNETQNSFKVELDITPESNENLKTTYRTALASQNPPDITFMFAGPRFIRDVADAGLVADLTPYETAYNWPARFEPAMYDDLIYQGTLYQIAWRRSPHPYVWYDRRVFDQLGLAVPDDRKPTLEEFNNYLEAVREAGYQTIALGNKDRWPAGHFYSIMCQRSMDEETLSKLRFRYLSDTGVDWTHPASVRALQWVQDNARAGWFAPGVNAMADGDALSLFASGQAAMFQAGWWGVYTIPEPGPDLEIDFFHYPQLDPNIPHRIISTLVAGASISSKSRYIDECAELLNFIVSEDGQRLGLEKANQFPGTILLRDKMDTVDLSGVHPLYPDILSEATPANPFAFEGDQASEIAIPGLQDLQSVMDGDMRPEDLAARIQELTDTFLGG